MKLVRYTYPTFRTLASVPGYNRSPWTGLEAEIGRLFESALADVGSTNGQTHFPVDLYEDKENTFVRAELPGVSREDINVEVVDGYLTIAATRKGPAVDGKSGESFAFSRSVAI